MHEKAFRIALDKNPRISVDVIPGHFATSIAHFNHFVDMGAMKFNTCAAKEVAREMALPYMHSTLVDSIFCMERTQVIATFMAEELSQNGTNIINIGREIHVITPIISADNKLLFPDNRKHLLANRNILLLMATITNGATLSAALECIEYYGGKTAGVSVLFASAAPIAFPTEDVNALFKAEDIPDFKTYPAGHCQMCREGIPLDAVCYNDGYTRVNKGAHIYGFS